MNAEEFSAGSQDEEVCEQPVPSIHFILCSRRKLFLFLASLAMHTIRLGPPWDVTATPSGMRHARKFGRPRVLDAHERVWLVCAHVPGSAGVSMNGTSLPALAAPGPFAADVTALLAPRNEVVFVVSSEGPLGAVALEIRSA